MLTKLLLLVGGLAAVAVVAVVAVVVYVDTLLDTGGLTAGGLGGGDEYYGPETLEERIARADVIARVRLLSVDAAAERRTGQSGYFGALEYRFQVLEYLGGSGAGELVAVVYDPGTELGSSTQAITRGNLLKDRRDTRWDDREAIVFLTDAHGPLPSTNQADRYWFSTASPYTREEYYTVASPYTKRWLPAEAVGGAVGAQAPGSGGQRFLLDAPADADGEAVSGQSPVSPPTITLADMKAKIAAVNREVAAGGGSQQYRDCLALKYEWERKVQYSKAKMGGVYYHIRYDETIASGVAANTLVHTRFDAPRALQTHGETAPANWGELLLAGRDEGLFNIRWPGAVVTKRPLTAGEYRFYHNFRPEKYVICEAMPEDELKRLEVVVTVTAPAGTVYEAYFDPLAGAAGVPSPSELTVGGTRAVVQRLEWRSGAVVLRLSPYADMAGHTLDFIALDGTTALSLDAGDATVNRSAGTLTWTVATQPWRQGDQLMLRISKGGATAEPSPSPTAGR